MASARSRSHADDPSDVARALGGEDWHPLMTPVRNAAVALAEAGQLLVLRKGKPVPPEAARGVIRLALPSTTEHAA